MTEQLFFDVDKGTLERRQVTHDQLSPVGQAFENWFTTPMDAKGIDLIDAFPTPDAFVETTIEVLTAMEEGEDVIGKKYPDAQQFFSELRGQHEQILEQLPLIAERLVDARYRAKVEGYIALARIAGDGLPPLVRRVGMQTVRSY